MRPGAREWVARCLDSSTEHTTAAAAAQQVLLAGPKPQLVLKQQQAKQDCYSSSCGVMQPASLQLERLATEAALQQQQEAEQVQVASVGDYPGGIVDRTAQHQQQVFSITGEGCLTWTGAAPGCNHTV